MSKGETVLGRLASVHRLKLRRIGPESHEILSELTRAWRHGFLRTMGNHA